MDRTTLDKLAANYEPALEKAVGALEKVEKPGTHSDLELAYDYLFKAQEQFQEVPDDPSDEELQSALTELTEVAERVTDYITDRSPAELDRELWDLSTAVHEAREAGLRDENRDPHTGLSWYGDDVPDDGTGH